MDFDFTPDQIMLRDSARGYLREKCTTAFVRSTFDHPLGYSREMWQELANLGWLGLTFSEEEEGQGLGTIELALLLEELGRAVFPGPYFAAVVLAGSALQAAGDPAQKKKYLRAIARGELIATMGLLEESIDWGPGGTRLAAQPDGDGYVLDGLKRFVPFAHAADVILVTARTSQGSDPADGVSLFLVDAHAPGVEMTPMNGIDLTSRASEVRLNNVLVPGENLIGPIGRGWPIVQQVLQRAAIGASGEMLGCARRCMELTVEYAKVREAFGQKIGQFQAIKHKLADMLVEVESAHSAVYYAAWAQDAGSEDAALAASVAKAYGGEASARVCGESIQAHGGIGFTGEHDLHLWVKRARYYQPLYGDAEYHYEQAAQALAREAAASQE